MAAIKSNIDIFSEKYKENFKYNKELSDQLNLTLDKIYLMGPEPNKIKHRNKGKLTARDRISHLIDKDTYFLELSTLAAYEVYGNDYVPAAGIITGVGAVSYTHLTLPTILLV